MPSKICALLLPKQPIIGSDTSKLERGPRPIKRPAHQKARLFMPPVDKSFQKMDDVSLNVVMEK